MLLEPEVLLLDEPSSSLDKMTEEKIIKMVVDYVNKNDRTLIMVTHSPDIAEKFADRIINIEAGKIVK
jgi:putative ABC transport system ATP-binding protein